MKIRRVKSWFIAIVAVATLITWLLGLTDYRYRVVGTLAFSSGFPGNIDRWELKGLPANVDFLDDRIRIKPVGAGPSSEVFQRFPLHQTAAGGDTLLRVSGTIHTVIPPDNSFNQQHTADFMVWFFDKTGLTRRYLSVKRLDGATTEVHAERTFAISDESVSYAVALLSRQSNGVFELSDVKVQAVEHTAAYPAAWYALLVMWATILAASARWLVLYTPKSTWIPLTILIGGTITGILVPESTGSGLLNAIWSKLQSAIPMLAKYRSGILFKVGHFAFFFMLGAVLCWHAKRYRSQRFAYLALLGLLILATEGLQLHLYDRSTRWLDIFVDAAGVATAWMLISTWLVFKHPLPEHHGGDHHKRRKRRRKTSYNALLQHDRQATAEHGVEPNDDQMQMKEESPDVKKRRKRRRRTTRQYG